MMRIAADVIINNNNKFEMQKLNYRNLGRRVLHVLQIGEESETKFLSLPSTKQNEVLRTLTEYCSKRKNDNLTKREARLYIQKISDILKVGNPLDICTRDVFTKFLGYDHVFELTYWWAFEKVTLSLEGLFSVELYERQKKLANYLKELSGKGVRRKKIFLRQKALIEQLLSERMYPDLKTTIMDFEKEYRLTESLYTIVKTTDEEDQVKGIFNAVVMTIFQLKRS